MEIDMKGGKPKMENNEQKASQEPQSNELKTYGLDEAIDLIRKGKVLHMIDNGHGYVLPGVLCICPTRELVELIQTNCLPENSKVIQIQLLVVNIVPVQNADCLIRFFTIDQFDRASRFVIDEPTPDELAIMQALKGNGPTAEA